MKTVSVQQNIKVLGLSSGRTGIILTFAPYGSTVSAIVKWDDDGTLMACDLKKLKCID